jgi:hypothetical protein
MSLYVVVTLLIVALIAVSGLFFVVGALGLAGVVRLTPCPRCAHMVMTSRDAEQQCPYCRHDHLAHPLRTMRHPFRELAHH